MLEHASVKGRHVVVAWGTQCKATYIDIDNSYMNSERGSTDTKLLLQAADATTCGAISTDICLQDIA